MDKQTIIKKANSMQGANREFSQEFGPIVEGILGLVDDAAQTPEIEDSLNSDSATKSLSAKQGKVLNETKQDAPAEAGTDGQILSIQSGEPAWIDAPEGTVVIDSAMSDESTNTVQNMVIKEYVDDAVDTVEETVREKYAKKDGYYSTLTAGAAENLVGQTVDSEAYLIRPTGGTENEVANGVASVLGMEGNSAVWNQIVQNGNFVDSSNINAVNSTVSVQNGVLTITAAGNSAGATMSIPATISEHKYLVKCYAWGDTADQYNRTCGIGFSDSSTSVGSGHVINPTSTDNTSRGILSAIITASASGYNYLALRCFSSTNVSFEKTMIFDLTLLGIDNLTTTAEVEAWLAEHVGTKPYYAYNAGTILSAQTLGIKTYGQNLLNPTTRQAKLIPYTWVENEVTYSNQYTIKNVPSGATATFTPDNTGVAESVTITDNMFDITSYGSGILELSAATADTYVCIKWNKQKDNDVVPYEDHTYDFDVRKVYGKVSGAGEYVQCYPNGMRSAGSVHDTLTASEAVVKIGSEDLGSKSFTLQSGRSFYTTLSDIKETNAVPIVINTGKYERNGDVYSIWDNEHNYFGTRNYYDRVYFQDLNCSTKEQIEAAMSGVKLNYELATPITYTDLIYRDGGIDRPLADVLMNIEVNNWSMEEQLMTSYDEQTNQPTSIPATIKTQYGMDAVEAIDTLQKTCYFADDVRANLQALLTCINTNSAETLGGTYAISDTATDKVFEFTFTPNTEPDVEPTNEGE